MDRLMITTLLILALGTNLNGQADGKKSATPSMSVNDLMVTVIAPATDTLWGIEEPKSDEEWRVFIDAANTVIDAANTLKAGGTGPDDNAWAADPGWQTFADTLIGAGVDARKAAQDKDIEEMFAAGEVLYPPCEECHIRFHSGVQ